MKIHHRGTSGLLLVSALLLAQTAFCIAHENPNAAGSRWLDRVANRKPSRHSGCAARPWVCHSRTFFPQLPFGKTAACCGNRCVDVKSDENNCGRCGKRCPFSRRCCNGKCIDPKSNPLHCGACNNRCAAGSRCTLGLCGYATQRHPFPHRRAPRRNRFHGRRHRRHPHSRS